MASKIVWGGMAPQSCAPHSLAMPRKARAHPKPKRRPTHIKAWRKHRELTQAKLVERLLIEEEIELSEAQLSRIESGKQPYSQDLLEALARVLRCEPPDLLVRDPTRPDTIWSIWEQLEPRQQGQLVEIGKTLKRTGT